MIESSRRKFLAATGAGAAAVGAAAVLPATAEAATGPDTLEADLAGNTGPMPVIVTIDDPGSGRISVLHGEREFTVTDRDLADRILGLTIRLEA